MSFDGRILVVGLGAVSRCAWPLLFKHLGVPARRYTVVDRAATEIVAAAARRVHEAGAAFIRAEVTRDNLPALLAAHAGPGDLIVDLSVNVGSADMIRFCHESGILYVNSSVETWPESAGAARRPPADRTLYAAHMDIRRLVDEWGHHRGPTAVLDHGANPGLVSHFTKAALEDIAGLWLSEHPNGEGREHIAEALGQRAWNCLAMHLGVQVIHISERDTQVMDAPKYRSTQVRGGNGAPLPSGSEFHPPFVWSGTKGAMELTNTWSAEAFYAETCHAQVEMGWGTHEKSLPPRAFRYRRGPRNQIRLDVPGISTRVRTWVPSGEIVGFVVPHSEAFTISDHLTVRANGRALYRPTVLFAYRPCDPALASLVELGVRDGRIEFRPRVLADEIVCGCDELGVLLMGHDYQSWWTGSVLDIEEARRCAPHQNATTLQVACSVTAACRWATGHRDQGVCVPDDLPHDEILADAKPYLGKFISRQVDWSPLQAWDEAQISGDISRPAEQDVWQFGTFLLGHHDREGPPVLAPVATGHES